MKLLGKCNVAAIWREYSGARRPEFHYLFMFMLTINRANLSVSMLSNDNQVTSMTRQAAWLRNMPQLTQMHSTGLTLVSRLSGRLFSPSAASSVSTFRRVVEYVTA